MTLSSVSTCAQDPALASRVTACIAQEQMSRNESVFPTPLLETMRWAVASASDVEAAYAFALLQENPNPGRDPTVITDAMILSHVQAHWPSAGA